MWNAYDKIEKMKTKMPVKDGTIRGIKNIYSERSKFWVSLPFLKSQERETRNKIAHLNHGCAPALQKKETEKI